MGCPIRISADERPFAPTRSFSQLTTSFFASESLGIPRVPLTACYMLCLFFYSVPADPFACFHKISLNASLLQSSSMSMNSLVRTKIQESGFKTFDSLFSLFSLSSTSIKTLYVLILGSSPIDIGVLAHPVWRMSESNRRPPACKAGALAS